jgi:hypothetical protein
MPHQRYQGTTSVVPHQRANKGLQPLITRSPDQRTNLKLVVAEIGPIRESSRSTIADFLFHVTDISPALRYP